jgi:hypothetical protein
MFGVHPSSLHNEWCLNNGFTCLKNGFKCLNNSFTCLNNGFKCLITVSNVCLRKCNNAFSLAKPLKLTTSEVAHAIVAAVQSNLKVCGFG